MFTEIGDGVFSHSDGYVVNLHSPFEAVYQEGSRSAKIYKEPGVGGFVYYFEPPIKWEPPYEAEALSEDKQQTIRNRVIAALRFRGMPFHM
jgi:hypothetical protein